VLELVPGESLDITLARGALQMDEALGVCAQIAAGVQAAHDQGILHRDLKPANIRRTPQGRVKVLDFGLAKALMPAGPSGDPMMSPTITHEGTIAGSILGTASYMSPEQARGKALDRRSDVWSFGCVLYEALAGRRAFPGETNLRRDREGDPRGAGLEPAAKDPAARHPPAPRPLPPERPERRIRDIGDARLEMAEALAARPGRTPKEPPRRRPAPRARAEGAAAAAARGTHGRGRGGRRLGARLLMAPVPAASPARSVRLEMVLPQERRWLRGAS